MAEFNIRQFVEEGVKTGVLKPVEAEKFARIIARQGQVGEVVNTYSENGILETTNTVELDGTTQQPGWIVTKAVDGKPLVDEFGHPNEWIITDSNFKKKYEVDPENPELFRPTGGKQTFVQTPVTVTFNASWGEEMTILSGGYLNITNLEDIYGIQERDFHDTYQLVDEQNKKSL